MSSWQFALLAISYLGFGFGCVPEQSSTGVETKETPSSPVIASLNGIQILESEFLRFINYAQGELNEDPSPIPTKELFRDFMQRKLLIQEALKREIEVEPEQIEAYIRDWTLARSDSDPELEDYVRDFLLTQQLLTRVVHSELTITLGEILSYYERNEKLYIVEDQAHVLEIRLENRDELEQIRSQVDDGDVQHFKELARAYSTGLTAELGGDLGIFQKGDLPEEFEKVIFALKPGEISQPFQSGHGYHLFFLEEWIPRHAQKFYEVRQEIFETLLAAKERVATEQFLKELVRNASIEIHDSKLNIDLEENRLDEELLD